MLLQSYTWVARFFVSKSGFGLLTDLPDIFSVIWIIFRLFRCRNKMFIYIQYFDLLSFYLKNMNMKQNLQNKSIKTKAF